MSGTYVFVETPEEVSDAVKQFGAGDVTFVATTASAYERLISRCDKSRYLDEYFSVDAYNRCASRNSEVIADVMGRLDVEVDWEAQGLPDGIEPFRLFQYGFKKVLDPLTFRYRALSQFFETERPDQVVYWEASENGMKLSTESPVRSPFDRQVFGATASHILNRLSETDTGGSSIVARPPVSSEGHCEQSSSEGQTVRQSLKDLAKTVGNANRLNGFRTVGLNNVDFSSEQENPITVLSRDSQVLRLLGSCLSEWSITLDWWIHYGQAPVSLRTGLSPVRDIEQREDRIEIDRNAVRTAFSTALDDRLPSAVGDILVSEILPVFFDELPSLAGLYCRARHYFEQRKPAAALCGATTRLDLRAIAQAARHEDVPVVAFQHGGLYGYTTLDILRFGDLGVPEIFCTFGDGVSRGLRTQLQDYDSSTEVVSVGATRQTLGFSEDLIPERESGRQDSADPTLLYVPTGYGGDMNYGPHYWYSDTEYLSWQLALTEFLVDCEGYDLVYKLHYKDKVGNPLKRFLDEQYEGEVSIVHDLPLREVLPIADVVLIDWPSTTLLETMLLKKPIVYLHLGWVKWLPEGERSAKRSVHWVDTEQGWRAELDETLTELKRTDYRESHEAFLLTYIDRNGDFSELRRRLFEPEDH